MRRILVISVVTAVFLAGAVLSMLASAPPASRAAAPSGAKASALNARAEAVPSVGCCRCPKSQPFRRPRMPWTGQPIRRESGRSVVSACPALPFGRLSARELDADRRGTRSARRWRRVSEPGLAPLPLACHSSSGQRQVGYQCPFQDSGVFRPLVSRLSLDRDEKRPRPSLGSGSSGRYSTVASAILRMASEVSLPLAESRSTIRLAALTWDGVTGTSVAISCRLLAPGTSLFLQWYAESCVSRRS